MGLGLALMASLGCSSEPDAAASETNGSSGSGAANEANPGSPNGSGGSGTITGVANFNRPAGMAIGTGASGPRLDPGEGEPEAGGSGGLPVVPPEEKPADIEIPDFETPPPPAAPPCSGCVELNVLVNDINQRDDFVFSAGGVGVTQVVWHLIIPFNSDQLFVQPFVDSAYGTFTDLDANAFPVGMPATVTQTLAASVNANNIGLAVGSSGAWTGNMTMSVFVDAVTIAGAGAAASRSFDAGLEGLATRTSAHSPAVVYHP
jgi:hypothetical protein